MKKKTYIKWFAVILISVGLIVCTVCYMKKNKPTEEDSYLKVTQILEKLSKESGYENALNELEEKFTTSVGGDTYYCMQQNYHGIPVYGRSLVYVEDKNGEMISLVGNIMDVDPSISLSPAVTQADAETKIEDYIENKLGFSGENNVFIPEISENELCIYNLKDGEIDFLAYDLQVFINDNGYVFPYKIVINAINGEVLQCCSCIYTEMIPMELKGKDDNNMLIDVNEKKDKDGKIYYTMVDEQRHIRIYSANNATLKYELYDYSDDLVVDQNGNLVKKGVMAKDLRPVWISEKGISQPISYVDPPKFEKKAVSLLANLQTTHDYYEDILDVEDVGNNSDTDTWINGFYNDFNSWDITNAYSWRFSKKYMKDMMFSFGSWNSLSLDSIAHEYTHGIEARRSGMDYIGESGAIMEALSDIFGELVESGKTKKNPDWVHNNLRNIAEPEKKGDPSTYKGENWKDTSKTDKKNDYGGVHTNCTVISHAAYLMWNGIDGNKEKRINNDNLAQLWYRAMLTMPSNCSFKQCRILVETAAQSMELTEEQIKCIGEAFDSVNIHSDVHIYELDTDATLLVLDKEGKTCSNYTISITPIYLETYVNSLNDVDAAKISDNKNNAKETRKVTSSNPYNLNLEEGIYMIILSDDQNTENDYVMYVFIKENGKIGSLSVQTKFEPMIEKEIFYFLNDAIEIGRIWQGCSIYNDAKDTVTGEYGGMQWNYMCVSHPKVHSIEELINITEVLYSPDVVTSLKEWTPYIERNGKLYLPEPDGAGGPECEKIGVRIEKSNEGCYNIRLLNYYNNVLPYQNFIEKYRYYQTDRGWVFDKQVFMLEDTSKLYLENITGNPHEVKEGDYIELVGIYEINTENHAVISLEDNIVFNGEVLSEVGIVNINYNIINMDELLGKRVLVYGEAMGQHTRYHYSKMMLTDVDTNIILWE